MNNDELIKYANYQLVENANVEVIEIAFSKDYIAHVGEKEYSGHDFIIKFVNQLHSAISGIKVLKIEFLANSDNTIAWQRTLSGVHKADMKGIPASNKKIKWAEMLVTRIDNGKIAEEWVVSELAGKLLLNQAVVK